MDNNCFDCQAEGQMCVHCYNASMDDDYQAMLEEVGI